MRVPLHGDVDEPARRPSRSGFRAPPVWRVLPLALLLAGPGACGETVAEPLEPAVPRLVVVLSVDQLRADYLTRFDDLFLPPRRADGRPGGFRWIETTGAWFRDAHHRHYPTYTGPGHAVLLTGAPPAVSGVVGNQWYDRAWRRVRYCAEGAGGGPAAQAPPSPESLLVTTVGDELETATGGRAKSWSFGFKDRAAIYLAGHAADGCFWFDEAAGRWTTSPWYGGDGAAPAWLREWNDSRAPDEAFGREWAFEGGPSALARLWSPPGDPRPEAFAIRMDRGKPASQGGTAAEAKAWYRTWARTPFANEWALASALRCVEAEGLGKDDVPDLLTVNLSTNDYVGHAAGPDSAAVLDLTVRTDRALADFLAGLDAHVEGGLAACVVALSADHGVAPNPRRAKASRFPAGVQPDDDSGGVSRQRDAAEKALDAAFGPADWVLAHVEHQLYLNPDALAHREDVPAERIESVAARACEGFEGIHACFTRTQILEGRLPDTVAARAVSLGFHRRNSGDVVIVADPYWSPVPSPEGATHGSVFPYDSHVPLLLAGFGIRGATVRSPVSTLDLAPTLSDLLGIARPSGCQGRVLSEALR